MITRQQVELARKNWIDASKNFMFELVTPYFIEIDGNEKEIFAFLPKYGSLNGTIVCLISAPNFEIDSELSQWADKNNFYCSFVNIKKFINFDESSFKEILNDWMKY